MAEWKTAPVPRAFSRSSPKIVGVISIREHGFCYFQTLKELLNELNYVFAYFL